MAKTYRLSRWRRWLNKLVRILLRLGWGPQNMYLLSVRGRKSGKLYSTPVTLVEEEGIYWLVAPYGEVSWVRNARAVGKVEFSRGGRSATVTIVELEANEAAPVLKQYIREVPITRPFFQATAASALGAFVAEAPEHPVFRIADPMP